MKVDLLNKIFKLYNRTEFTRKHRLKARTKRTVVSSRPIEYFWAIRHLTGKRILDVGSTGSLFPYQLARVGYDVYVIDLRDYLEWHGTPHPNLHVTVGNICDMPYPNNYFDTVTAISTLEHIGELKYNGEVGKHLEEKAMQEIHRVTKLGGRLIMTVPTCCKVDTGNPKTNYIKHYDLKTLRGKLRNYTILEHRIYPYIYSEDRSLTCAVVIKQPI